uniref:Putative secreted protein n=1 Tax=Anopheles darlingi TaxID=43151 RepID=A0A2M4DBE8_ANODA
MVRIVITLVHGVLLPIVNVNALDTAHQKLELVLIEDLEQRQRYERIDALQERLHLILDPGFKPPVDHEPYVLVLVVVRHIQLGTTRFQLPLAHRTEALLIHAERQIEFARIVLLDVEQRVVVLRIDRFHVLQIDRFLQHHLVERSDKERIQKLPMVDGHSSDPSDESEVIEMLLVTQPTVRIDL